MPASRPTSAPARSTCRSSCRRRSRRTVWAAPAAATSTAAPATPPAAPLEAVLASLEGARFGRAFASGLAAEDAVLRLLEPGRRVVLGNDAYGGTFRLIDKVFGRTGIGWSVARSQRPRRPRPGLARRHRAGVGRDAQQPDADRRRHRRARRGRPPPRRPPGGRQHLRHPLPPAPPRARCGRGRALDHQVPVRALRRGRGVRGDRRRGARRATWRSSRTRSGRCRAPSTATSRCVGVKTLAVRMDRHCANAAAVADALAGHPAVARVLYPGLPEHPGHGIATKQMRDFGGMVSFLAAGRPGRGATGSSPARRCSRWPSRWARWSR